MWYSWEMLFLHFPISVGFISGFADVQGPRGGLYMSKKRKGVDYKSDLSSGQNLTVVAWQTYYMHFVLVVINANNCIGFF